MFFDILDKIGIQTSEVLQITTVFSLGLSWSMRDWLSSLWASFMIAFTTQLSVDSTIRIGTEQTKPAPALLRVVKTGLIFTVCTTNNNPEDKNDEIYIPNSSLVSRGFTIHYT